MEEREVHIKGSPWAKFAYEVNRATASLLHLLRGTEWARSNKPFWYNRRDPSFAFCFLGLSYLDVPLFLSGTSSDLDKLLDHAGEAEQLAFKGWMVEVYNSIWEGWFRNELKERSRDELKEIPESHDICPPEIDVLGDFRHIRNDLVHGGKASKDETGKCKVLKWFEVGDSIILGMHHVFDFLNQLGFMTVRLSYEKRVFQGGTIIRWKLSPDMNRETLESKPVPKLISLRTFIDVRKEGVPYAISVVFENGVFVNTVIDDEIPTELIPDDLYPWEKIRLIYKNKIVCINEDGNVRFANGGVIDRKSLYRKAIDVLFGDEPAIELEMGVPGPWVKLTKPKS